MGVLMNALVSNITAFQPVYRVLHREENLDFFRDVLGFKVLVEEGAMVFLGGHTSKVDRLQLEESPGFRSVEGTKKHTRTVIQADSSEIEQLLARDLTKISKIYQGKTGFAFEAISPENDVYLLTSDALTDLSALTELEKSTFSAEKNENFKGLSDFAITALKLTVSSTETIEYYERVFGLKAVDGVFKFPFVSLKINVETLENVETDEVLDLEFLIFMIDKAFDLRNFAEEFSDEDGVYLDGGAKTLSLEAPENIELWFVK
jgi:catechol 2,3-dioxygenase-like lactoylglutathione lyase family enzyme